MTYTLTNTSSVIRDLDKATIPADPANMDYQVYLIWVAAGNVANPVPTPPIVVPQSVSRRQFYQAAAQNGLITQGDALAVLSTGVIPASLAAVIAALPAANQFAAQMAIIGEPYYIRSDSFVIALGTAMGQTSAQVDALFILAGSL